MTSVPVSGRPPRGCRCAVRFSGLIALLLAIGISQPAFADPALDDYNLATGLYKQKRWEQSAEAFRTFIDAYPENVKIPLARLYLGLTLVHQKKYDDSRTVLRGFVKDYPRSKYRPDAMYRVAECSYFLDDFKAAEAEFLTFLRANPKNELAEWALPYLADSQRRLDKLREAAGSYRQALEQFPRNRFTEESTFGLGRTYELLKQSDDALEQYRKVAANPKGRLAPDAQLAIATVLFDSDRFDEAAVSYEKFLAAFPESDLLPQAEINAGYAFYQAGRYAKAVTYFDRAGRREGQAVTAGYWKGVSHKALGQFAEAAVDLEAAFKADEKGQLAENALFQWADSEYQRGQLAAARGLFLDLVTRWPQGELADDSLHLAAEAALKDGKLDEGDQLVARFSEDYAGSALRMYNRILDGRLRAARGDEKNLKAAAARFREVIDTSAVSRTRSLARFQLARALQLLDDNQGVLEAAAPLTAEIAKEGQSSEFVDVLIVAAGSQLALKKYDDAEAAASLYLKLKPDESLANQALATRAIARAYLKDKQDSQADIARLLAAAPESPLAQQTSYTIAEIAYDQKDWNWSAALYEQLVARGSKSANHAHALSGLAWCRFEQKKYLEAAEYFGQLVEQHPDEPVLAPEAAFKRAESLENASRLADAAAAYGKAFEIFAPAEPPETGAEQKPPLEYAFLSGLNRARVLRSLKKTDEADAAYEQLLTSFPQPADLDRRLDEWALLNYDAGNYKRSDEIFARLVKQTPDSELADNARLSLAESELLAGRTDAARVAFNKLQADGKSDKQVQVVSLHHLIGIAVEAEEWKEVRALAGDLIERFPESTHTPHAEFQTANALLNEEQYAEAQAALLKLKSRFAEKTEGEAAWVPQIWIMLAETYFREKKYQDVEATVAALRARDPECPLLYQADEILGRSYKNQAMFDQSRAAFHRVVEDKHGRRTETAAKAQFLLAETYLIQKDYKNAQTEHFRVYHLYKFPTWQSASLYQAALCDEALKRWAGAAKLYEELLRKFPESEFAAKAKERLPLARKNAGG